MNDNDIIKALECCHKGSDCSGCLLGNLHTNDGLCIRKMQIDALADALNGIALQKAVIDDLKAKERICAKVIARQDKEIENLSKSVDNYESCLRSVGDIKANAIKEFAERLNIHVIPQKRDGYTCDIILKSSIDNLVKEMTEAQNAPHNNSSD